MTEEKDEVAGEQIVMRPAAQQDSMTVVEQIYHQPAGEEPTAYHHSFVRKLFIQEQPYSRKIKVGGGWQPLDLGWFADKPDAVGMVQVINNEGRFTQTQPTDEERAAAAAKVIEVVGGMDDPTRSLWKGPVGMLLLVYPKESMRNTVERPNNLWVRCQSGVACATVNVFPR